MGYADPQNYKEAARYLKLAVEQGFTPAHFDLGKMYYYGDGVDQDYVHAFMWWKIADINGFDEANKVKKMFYEKKISSQINKGQKLTKECIKKNYKDC